VVPIVHARFLREGPMLWLQRRQDLHSPPLYISLSTTSIFRTPQGMRIVKGKKGSLRRREDFELDHFSSLLFYFLPLWQVEIWNFFCICSPIPPPHSFGEKPRSPIDGGVNLENGPSPPSFIFLGFDCSYPFCFFSLYESFYEILP